MGAVQILGKKKSQFSVLCFPGLFLLGGQWSWELCLKDNRVSQVSLLWDREDPGVPLPKRSPPHKNIFLLPLFSFNREITVTLGAHDVSKKEPTQQKIKVKKQIVHPNYSFYSNLNDIMLLKVPLFFLPFLPPSSLALPLAQALNLLLSNAFPRHPPLNSMSLPPQWARTHSSLGYHVFPPSPCSFKGKLSRLPLWIQSPCLDHQTLLNLGKHAGPLAGEELG